MSDPASVMPEHPPVTDWVHDFDHTDPRWTEIALIWEELWRNARWSTKRFSAPRRPRMKR
jgi:hypothetical protein